MPKKTKTHESYSFRLPVDLHEWLRKDADEQYRTIGAHLEALLTKLKEEETASK